MDSKLQEFKRLRKKIDLDNFIYQMEINYEIDK